jgi:hypothetical protein
MSRIHAESTNNNARIVTRAALLGAACFVALGVNLAAARESKVKVEPRAMQAYSDSQFATVRTCIPANGAQILGGFAGADDLLDIRTGEVCGKR